MVPVHSPPREIALPIPLKAPPPPVPHLETAAEMALRAKLAKPNVRYYFNKAGDCVGALSPADNRIHIVASRRQAKNMPGVQPPPSWYTLAAEVEIDGKLGGERETWTEVSLDQLPHVVVLHPHPVDDDDNYEEPDPIMVGDETGEPFPDRQSAVKAMTGRYGGNGIDGVPEQLQKHVCQADYRPLAPIQHALTRAREEFP